MINWSSINIQHRKLDEVGILADSAVDTVRTGPEWEGWSPVGEETNGENNERVCDFFIKSAIHLMVLYSEDNLSYLFG